MGQAPPGSSYNTTGLGLPLLAGPGNFSGGRAHTTKFTTSPTQVSVNGEMIIGVRASIGDAVIGDREYCLGRGVAALRPSDALVDRYLWHWFARARRILASKARGATFVQVNRRDIESLELELPPPAEQRRVAAILDRADDLRATRGLATDLVHQLSHSIFDHMFRETMWPPVRAAWEAGANEVPFTPLIDVAELATGHTPDRKIESYWHGDVPWIALPDARALDGRVATETAQRISRSGVDNSSAVILPPNTVCFSRTASVGFVTVTGVPMATSQDWVNWTCGERLDPLYLMEALRISRPSLMALSSGSTHKTIYVRVAEQFCVSLPPIELQRKFAERVRCVWSLATKQLNSHQQLEVLFASLQGRAFRGEL